MKKIKKALLSLGLACACSLFGAFMVSCKKEKDVSTVTISYDTMGAPAMSGATVKEGEKYTLPTPAQREGYKFLGWYTTSTFEGEPVTEIVTSGNVTYYAKWVQAYAVNLDLNGGTLDVSKIYLATGENVYEAVKSLIPQRANLTFGAWFNGNQELSKNYVMKSEALSLKAQYKVAYTVNVYLQKLDGTGYQEPVTTVGSEYVGKTFTSKQTKNGYKEVSDTATLQKVLSTNASENVFNHYFERNTYTVTLNPNYPGVTNNKTVSYPGKFESKIELPSDPSGYVSEGYCFLGWTDSKTSQEVKYKANLDELLYNGSQTQAQPLEYTISSTTTLYGVWQKGYVDMFGGDDYIFYIEDTNEVYLNRGNVYFKGEFDKEENEFYFKKGLEGKFVSGDKFLYYDTSSERVKNCKLYVVGEGIIESTVIRLQKDNALTYDVYGESDKVIESSKGTYEILENGEYFATFTDGTRAGQTLNFLVGVVRNEDGGTQPAFQVRNDKEANIGEIVYTGVLKNADGYYSIGFGQMSLYLDGFGTATLVASGQAETYKYRLEEDGTLILNDMNDKPVATLLVFDVPENKGVKGYMVYKEALDTTFTLGDNETLTLDGVYNAVYKKGTEKIESYYTSTTTPMGNVIVSIIDSKRVEHKFLLTPSTEYDAELDAEVVVYTAKSVLNTYAEYYYKDQKTIYYAPMLVVDETVAGKATLYGYTPEKTYVKISDGTYEKGSDGLYVYTVNPDSIDKNTDAYNDPINLENIQSFVFAMDTEHTNYSVHFWYSSSDGATYYTDLENTDITSEATLKLVGGFAFYKETSNSLAIIGAYTITDDILTFNATDKDYYFYVDEENAKFTVLQYAPYQAYKATADGKLSANYSLSFDGLGGAVYTKKGTNGATDVLISGMVTEVKNNGVITKTEFGDVIYAFTPTASEYASEAFRFIVVEQGNNVFFATLQGKAKGKYYSASTSNVSGVLTIDGYCCKASFATDDETYEGFYYVDGDCIVFMTDDELFYFDFTGDEFTVRGAEYGSYAIFQNKRNENLFVDLDGYGNFNMYLRKPKAGSDTEFERQVLIENGNYQINGEVFTFSYGSESITCVSNGRAYEDYEGNVYYGLDASQELANTLFVDTTDWSVLILDEYNRAVKYNAKGQREIGQFTLITAPEDGDEPNTEYLLYFVNDQRSVACIYTYNVQTNEATPVVHDARSYYTEDLQSLYFSNTGFAVLNGDTSVESYYIYEGDNVVIYRRAEDGETANSCGFVRVEFGKLEETKTYEGKVYYRNYGTDISFKREATEIAKYPILQENSQLQLKDLIFAPSGSAEFEVTGTAVFTQVFTNGSESKEVKQTCKVTRELVDGEMVMYVTVGGAYRYYIDATYQGGSQATSVYEVQGLRYVQTLTSYYYLDVLFRIYYMYGAASANAYENNFGTITIDVTYGENGEVSKSSMSANFGEAYELYDQNGNPISFEESKFTFTAQGGVAEFTVKDTEGSGSTTYRLYFGVQAHQYLGAQGYYVIAFTRVQTLSNNGYEVIVDRVLSTDVQDIEVGNVYSIEISDGTQVLKGEEFYKTGEAYTYVVRERDSDGYVTKATYFTITLEENEMGGGTVDENAVATFKSATIEKADAVIVCEKDPTEEGANYKGKDRYVEIVNGEIKFLNLVKNKRYAKSSTYENGVYKVETTDGRTYYVKYTADNQNVIIADSLEELV